MPRYIDADALMEVIREHDYPLANRTNSIDRGMFTVGIQQAVDEQPTADVVEVVRCKDCQWYGIERACPLAASGLSADCIKLPKEDDFCSYGERRNDG